ncbi:MAG: magnesium transporter MgtC [Aequorivita sp.]|nr:magnesium transporter MgtC [Aequorivita sp.]|tara:strand:+ start:148 stop:591 length:444 start_codon:yes stop_codon:yes gene_type:complete
MEPLSETQFILNIVLAAIAGVCVGIERQMKNKNAGLKTYALVALGASVFIGISFQYANLDYVDFSRITGQVVVGVGFLGAGVIIKRKNHVSGIATAAAIWCSAALGCLAGLSMYIELAATTGLIVIINLVMGYYNRKMVKTKNNNNT